ncbi:MAG TPA: hypothetical protein VGS57_15860 [Thermoanaerobaculia bacterium]|jgi:hypothetical protein|nr:hypothetical protein [Thermoanaerobaculia bacterium]
MTTAAVLSATRSARRARLRRALAVAAFVVAPALAIASSASAQAADHAVDRRYKLRFLAASDAVTVGQELCPAEGRCDMIPLGPYELHVIADAATQTAIAKALQAADLPPAAQAFQLVLLEAHRGAGGTPGLPEGLPASARKALADVADFLPYGRFDLLAPVAFVRTTHDARVTVASDEDFSYELELAFRGDARKPGAELLVEGFRLRLVPAEPILVALAAQPGFSAGAALPRRTPAPGGAPTSAATTAAPMRAENAVAPANPAPPAAITPPPTVAENLLSTSFSIRKGETVVVGTSKLNGNDRALVVLLTALP